MLAIARAEWGRARGRLLALGVLCGILGGLAVGAVVVARRTATAPDRLAAAVRAGDVQLRVFDPRLVDEIAALPDVAGSWVGSVAVGQLLGRGELQYVGIVAGPVGGDLFRPVVVEGRAADPRAGDEVVVTEDAQRLGGFAVGDRLRISLLTAEEVSQFDTGFGDPDGGTVDAVVTGVVRVPPGIAVGTPLIATPGFLREHQESVAGADMFVALRSGTAGRDAFVDHLRALSPTSDDASARLDFAPVSAGSSRAGTDALVRSARVLRLGLWLTAAASIAVAALVSAVTLARHAAAGATLQRIEEALGLPRRARARARTLPSAVSALVAGVITVVSATVAGWVEPIGTLAAVEPTPGWRGDPLVTVLGSFLVAAGVLVTAHASAWRADVPGRRRPRRSRVPRGIPGRGGWPLAGAAFALGGGRRAPVRSALPAASLGVAGLTAALCFATSLDRLVDQPARQGWTADAAIADVSDADLAMLRADPAIDTVTEVASSTIVVDGREVEAYAFVDGPGELTWDVVDGRPPHTSGEVVIGTLLAREAALRIGDRVRSGPAIELTVVGIGLGPDLNGERLGTSVWLTAAGRERVAATSPFREALVTVAPGERADVVLDRYAAELEIARRRPPDAVRDVEALGDVPLVLGGLVGLGGLAVSAHSLASTARDRAGSLGALRALGLTSGRTALTIIAAATVTAVVAVVVGIPLGLAVARLLWGEVAASIGVRNDLALRPALLAAIAAGTWIAIDLCALAPAMRVRRADPAQALRSE